jgi:hypothetical protein
VVISLRFKLRAILIETVSVDSKGVENVHTTGVCDCARRRDYKKENMSLNQPANRGAFVKF